MTTPRLVGTITQLWQKGIRTARRLDKRTHGWLGILAGAARETFKPNSTITAAAIAYYATFSVFPLTLLSIAIASFSLGPLVMNQQTIVLKLEFVAPALGQLLGNNINEIIRARGPVTIVAIASLVWSASSIFYMLNQTLHEIWVNKRSRPVWKQRGLAILFVLAFVGPALILGSFASSMIGNLRNWLPAQKLPIGDGISLVVVSQDGQTPAQGGLGRIGALHGLFLGQGSDGVEFDHAFRKIPTHPSRSELRARSCQ